MIGRQVSHFYIIGKLGSGGMGDVYEAQDMRLPRSVAVKFLRPDLSKNAIATRRFKREARLAASLNHPNICTILDVGDVEGLSFIAMELLRGESLKQRLQRGPLPLPDILDIAADVAKALVAAHASGIMHRDITPGNIFITEDRVVKILDFGLAKAIAGEDELEGMLTDGVTTEGAVAGTVHYLAPEQLRQHRKIDRRCDLFALGAVLYHAATGTRPFESRLKSEVIAHILNHDPMPIRHLVPEHPVAFERLVFKLLEKNPDRRYQRASDLLKDLHLVRDQLGTARPPSPAIFKPGASLSVAVLPFTLVGGDEDPLLRRFRDGVAEDIAWWLQSVPGIRVAPRTSTDTVRGKSLRTIGAALGVSMVLEGTIQRSGATIRVIANLVDASTEEAVRAAQRIDVIADDQLTAQDEAARDIVAGIKSTIARANIGIGTKNAEAHFEYQRGLHHLRDLFSGGWSEAIGHATRATELDPRFALAHVMTADAYCFLGLLSMMKPRIAFEKARLAAERALQVDEHLASAHAALALVRFGGDWDWDGAEASFRRALDIDADFAIARIHYSWLLGILGREAAALTEAERAVATSHSRLVVTGAALTSFMANRYTEAIERCRECLRASPDYIFATYLRGQCYHMLRMYSSAHADLEHAADLGHRAPFFLGLLGKSYGESGSRGAALRIIDELEEAGRRQYVAPHCYVYIYQGLGDHERALSHQEQAYSDGASPLNYFTPFIRHLFSLDPDHRDRLRQMRLNL